MAEKIWFITGTSKGFGREWAIAALERGDKVAATARDTQALSDLVRRYGDGVLPIELDVTDREAAFAAVELAVATFGRLDVVVNNAGYGHYGFVEEVTEAEARAQFETNLFGALWVTQAVLPQLRQQGSGHIIQTSSMGGVSAAIGLGIYSASKFALEGFSQSLAQEVAGFGINVTLVEPGGYATDWRASSKKSVELPHYAEAHAWMENGRQERSASRGDPAASAAALLKVVDSDEPPLRIIFGGQGLSFVEQEYDNRLAEWRKWRDVSTEAQG